MKVVEIFKSIDGEGRRTGLPVTFIRLYGCNLNCSYCDTRYGCVGNNYTEMSVKEICQKVIDLGLNRVTITGGEPLIHESIIELIKALDDAYFDINIETNGSVAFLPFVYAISGAWVTMDYKCPSSGMEDNMVLKNLKDLRVRDVLKFVVSSEEDLEAAKYIINTYHPRSRIYLSPVFGEIEAKDIVKFVLDNNLSSVYTQVQLHKIIWDPDMKGV